MAFDQIKLEPVYIPNAGGSDQVRLVAVVYDSGAPISGPQADANLTAFSVTVTDTANTAVASFTLSDFADIGSNAAYGMVATKTASGLSGGDVLSFTVSATYSAVTINEVFMHGVAKSTA